MGWMMTMKIRTYTELIRLPTFEERFEYLKIGGKVGRETFGSDRYINQILYHSPEWQKIRREVVSRDGGFDLGVIGCDIQGTVTVHHMNPITLEDVMAKSPFVYDPEYLITVSTTPTHRAIHYADSSSFALFKPYEERKPNDTCPWRK